MAAAVLRNFVTAEGRLASIPTARTKRLVVLDFLAARFEPGRVYPEPAVNAVFAAVPASAIVPLQDWSFFWEWDLEASIVRWMTSFSTTEEDVDRFVAGVRAIVAEHQR